MGPLEHAGIQIGLSGEEGGCNLDFFFFFGDDVREDLNTTIAAHHWSASEMPFKWLLAACR